MLISARVSNTANSFLQIRISHWRYCRFELNQAYCAENDAVTKTGCGGLVCFFREPRWAIIRRSGSSGMWWPNPLGT